VQTDTPDANADIRKVEAVCRGKGAIRTRCSESPEQAEALWAEWRAEQRELDDLLATLVAFTAEAVSHACREHLRAEGELDRLLVGGGGARNPALMAALQAAMPRGSAEPFDAVGVPSAAAEAMAFSLLGRNALLGLPNHLPRCTGAHRTAVLGEIVPAHSGRVTGGR